MDNEPNCMQAINKTNKNPDQIFTLTLRELPDREFTIRVAGNSLSSIISILSKHFFIEIE